MKKFLLLSVFLPLLVRSEAPANLQPPIPSTPSAPQAVVTLADGSSIKGTLPAQTLTLDTLLGPLSIPLSSLSSLTVETAPTGPTDRPLYHCTFDSPESIVHPAAGPGGVFFGGEFVPGKVGNALRVEAERCAFETLLPAGFLGPEGRLEFWAKIESGEPRYTDGGDPIFFSLFRDDGRVTLLQFAANNGFARGGAGGAMCGWPFGTEPHWGMSQSYAKTIGESWADWHHYELAWKADGFADGSHVSLSIDGARRTIYGGVDDDKLPARLAELSHDRHTLGAPWPSRRGDNRRSNRPFLIDELKIWKTARSETPAP